MTVSTAGLTAWVYLAIVAALGQIGLGLIALTLLIPLALWRLRR